MSCNTATLQLFTRRTLQTGVVAAGALLTTQQAEALDQNDSSSTKEKRTKVVVLGSGWAAISFLKALRPLHSTDHAAACPA